MPEPIPSTTSDIILHTKKDIWGLYSISRALNDIFFIWFAPHMTDKFVATDKLTCNAV